MQICCVSETIAKQNAKWRLVVRVLHFRTLGGQWLQVLLFVPNIS